VAEAEDGEIRMGERIIKREARLDGVTVVIAVKILDGVMMGTEVEVDGNPDFLIWCFVYTMSRRIRYILDVCSL